MANVGCRSGSSHVAVPAIKTCPRCGKDRVNLNRCGSYAVGYDGRLICTKCVQAEHAVLDALAAAETRPCETSIEEEGEPTYGQTH